jgi:RHS repeat-associated protein
LNYLGTSDLLTNASQTSTATRTYDAFGSLVASTGTPVGPFGFVGAQGYQEDGDSGLKLLGHRYYDPTTGRFLTRDPAKDDRNWYSYCGNGPTKLADEGGLQAEHKKARPSTRDKHHAPRAGGPEGKDPGMNKKPIKNPPTQPSKDSPEYLRKGPKQQGFDPGQIGGQVIIATGVVVALWLAPEVAIPLMWWLVQSGAE